MLEPEFAVAALPLFADEAVEILEWSFDMLWSGATGPDWLQPLLQEYSAAGRLLGHGVQFSMFTVPDERAQAWCARLADECRAMKFRHVTEHFGFMVAGAFHRGAPLPVPFTPELVKLGKERVRRLADAAGVRVGLENLAFAFGLEDVRRQGEFLHALLTPVDGMILLDLHNVYCQSYNFGLSPKELISAYPLEMVRELHLSGGSWSEAEGATVRRDTHDGPVPEALYPMLQYALEVCPNIEAVILEQLGSAFATEESRANYREDFARVRKIVHEFRGNQRPGEN